MSENGEKSILSAVMEDIASLKRLIGDAVAEISKITSERNRYRMLVAMAINNADYRSTSGKMSRWAYVADRFGLGSTSATELCLEFERNPDDKIGSDLPLYGDEQDIIRDLRGRICTLQDEICNLREANEDLEEAVNFYADPDTWFAVALFPDSPCGNIMDDYSDVGDGIHRPGRRARIALGIEAEKEKKEDDEAR